MEQSVKELSSILPSEGVGSPNGRTRSIGSLGGDDDVTAAQLRQILREKNEKISLLTAEFDAHRADFRSTLDSLEMASTETERVYEEQKRDLMQQLAELQEVKDSKEDFEGITTQLKQLEELVAELEEGLEESRRGEAEARGEVEFLRGEVERGRSELKREREKAAAAVNGNGGASTKELEQKDDEIRGLKAIIHGLSSNPASPAVGAGANANGILADAGEVKRLQVALNEAQNEKEGLEREVEQLRRDAATTNGVGHARNESVRTATAPESRTPARSRSNTVKASLPTRTIGEPLPVDSANGDPAAASGVYCEMCESSTHDTLDCAKLQGEKGTPYSPGKENEKANGKGVVEEDKWCALCEKDGHLAFDCPEEQY
jgi:myosin heavy subunit